MDRRKKACPNETCETYKKKKYDATVSFCPYCGEKLVFVCKSHGCYKPLEDKGPKHTTCEECIARRDDKIDSIKQKAGKAAKGAVGAAGAIFIGAFSKEARNAFKEIADKAAKKAVKIVRK